MAMTYGWRYDFWKMMVDAGRDVDMVGSLNGGFNGDADWPDYQGKAFDRDHEGHWGWPASQIATELPEWIKTYTPDIAIILLGTNFPGGEGMTEAARVAATKKDIADIIATLRTKNPKVAIVIGEPFQDWAFFPALSQAYQDLAKETSTAESPVVTQATKEGWVSDIKSPDTCTVDWVHPNQKGDALIAKAFFGAVEGLVKKSTALTPAP